MRNLFNKLFGKPHPELPNFEPSPSYHALFLDVQQHFTLTPDNYLLATHLIAAQGQQPNYTQLKYQLAPLFCTNEKQQNDFYTLFSNWQRNFETEQPKKQETPPKPETKEQEENAIDPSEEKTKPPTALHEEEQEEEAPYVISLKDGRPSPLNFKFELRKHRIHWSAGQRLAFQQMRAKGEVGEEVIDVPATIRQSIQRPTDVSLSYTRHTQHQSYFILVEQSYQRGHTARFVEQWAEALRQHDVEVFLAFYQNDPRILYNAQLEFIGELQHIAPKHENALLLFFGTGNALIDLFTMQFFEWTTVLDHFPQRTFFQTDHPQHWSMREVVLAEQFDTLQPLNPNGLQSPATNGKEQNLQQLRQLKRANLHLLTPIAAPHDYRPENFELWLESTQLPPHLLKWLAACALYPELNWEMTIELGAYLSKTLNENLLTDENLLQLLRLSFFQRGHLPLEANAALKHNLLPMHEQMPLHAHIASFMKENLNKKGKSSKKAALQIAIHELLATDNADQQKEIAKRFDKKEWEQAVDFVNLHQLEGHTDAVQFVIPPAIVERLKGILGSAVKGKVSSEQPKPKLFLSHDYGGRFRVLGGEKTPLLSTIHKTIEELGYQIRESEYEYTRIQEAKRFASTIKGNDILVIIVTSGYVKSPYAMAEAVALMERKDTFANAKVFVDNNFNFNKDEYHIHWKERIAELENLSNGTSDDIKKKIKLDIDAATFALKNVAAFVDAIQQLNYISVSIDDLPNHLKDALSHKRKQRLKDYIENYQNLNIKLLPIKGGKFQMGSEKLDREKPIHPVTVNDFYMAETPVTNAQFTVFLNEKGNQKEGGTEWINLDGSVGSEKCRIVKNNNRFEVEEGYGEHPVIYVSWYAARAFCAWLNEKPGKNYQLPSEAQWEYAAGGGDSQLRMGGSIKYDGTKNFSGFDAEKRTKWAGTNDENELVKYAWYDKNSDQKTHPVKLKKENQLGLYDMSGNVWEWCADEWHGNYEGAPEDDRPWMNGNGGMLLRGGSWFNVAVSCRVAVRSSSYPGFRDGYTGFRIIHPVS